MLEFLKARNQQQDDTHNIDDENRQSRLAKSDASGHIWIAFELEVFVEGALFRFRKLYNLLNLKTGILIFGWSVRNIMEESSRMEVLTTAMIGEKVGTIHTNQINFAG